MSHTPTPWAAFHNIAGEGFIHALHKRKVSNNGVLIATLPASEQREANAAHIVHCVNVHDQLVAALKACMHALDVLDRETGYVGGQNTELIVKANELYLAALAAAEKGA